MRVSCQPLLSQRPLGLFALAAIFYIAWSSLPTIVPAGDDPWPDIRDAAFQKRDITETSNAVTLYAPDSAKDAALVPITIRIPAVAARTVKSLTLVIDRNPAPIAAKFAFADAYRQSSGSSEQSITTRVRLDSFSKVRAVLEDIDGRLYMNARFVQAAGGCSAAAAKDIDQALTDLGKAQVKVFKDDSHSRGWREAQLMIRHPNFTGMQIDPMTKTYTPARFIDHITVRLGNEVLFEVETGIALSADPSIRFTFSSDRDDAIELSARDTSGLSITASPDQPAH